VLAVDIAEVVGIAEDKAEADVAGLAVGVVYGLGHLPQEVAATRTCCVAAKPSAAEVAGSVHAAGDPWCASVLKEVLLAASCF
jgi:hypothetical protein